jgi:SAM-dependent methyltransferase
MTDPLTQFYTARSEARRLSRGIGPLEAARTLEILERHLPPPPATVYDVGGGTGFYSRRLSEQGYVAHLVDPVGEHVRAAREGSPRLASAEVADARALPWPDESADVVLLMGPLYHLQARQDRITALREANRVLRPGALLFATIIPRWASALIGMIQEWVFDASYAEMVHEEVTSGVHRRPDQWPNLFMDGYFHGVDDVTTEMTEGGFSVGEVLAIEGPAWMCANFTQAWEDPERRDQVLAIARLAETDSSILAASPHVAIVSRKASRTVA